MKWLYLFLAVLIAGMGALIIFNPFAAGVVVSKSKRGTAVSAVSGHVTVVAPTRADLRSEVEGDVSDVIKPPKSAARKVSKGDSIVLIDTREIDIEIAIAEANLERAQGLLESESHYVPLIEGLEKELADQEVLLEAGKISPNQVENTRRNLRRHRNLMEAETINHQRLYDSSKAALDRLLLRKEKYTIRTPIDGTLDAVFVYKGEHIRNNAKVAEVIGDGRFVSADVSEEDLNGVEPGQPVTVRLLAYGNRLFQGTVRFLAHTADEDTRRRNVSINLDIDRELLVPGLTGQASIIKGQKEDSVIIPRRALVGSQVYVVEEGKVHVRKVETGLISTGTAEIISGVSEGEMLIVETPHIYRDGERVKIQEVISF